MGIPVMAITLSTLPMITEYHTDDRPTLVKWLRVHMTLHAVQHYNNGQLSEENLHMFLDIAHNPDDNFVWERACELLSD